MVIDSYESKCVFGMKLITERNEWKALSGCLNSISWKKIHDGRFFFYWQHVEFVNLIFGLDMQSML